MTIRIGRLFETARARKGHTCKFAVLTVGVAARNLKLVPFAAKSPVALARLQERMQK